MSRITSVTKQKKVAPKLGTNCLFETGDGIFPIPPPTHA